MLGRWELTPSILPPLFDFFARDSVSILLLFEGVTHSFGTEKMTGEVGMKEEDENEETIPNGKNIFSGNSSN